MDDPTDFELIEGLQNQDRRAYFVLKDRYQKRLLTIAEAISHNPQDADEIVQQVFDQIWKDASSFDRDRERSVALWLYSITNQATRSKQKRWFWLRPKTPQTSIFETSIRGVNRLPPPFLIGGASLLGVTLLAITYATWATWQLYLKPIGYTSTVASDADITRIRDHSKQALILRNPYQQSSSLAQVFWSPTDQQLLFVATEFPQARGGKTYQLWAETTSSQAETSVPATDPARVIESAGTFAVPEAGSVQFLSPVLTIPDPNRFFVTLEPRGGSERPQGEIVLVSSYSPVELSEPSQPDPIGP